MDIGGIYRFDSLAGTLAEELFELENDDGIVEYKVFKWVTGCLVFRNEKTGKGYGFALNELIEIAEKSGIDKED